MRLPPAGDLMLACVCVLNCVWRQFRTKPCHVTTAEGDNSQTFSAKGRGQVFFWGVHATVCTNVSQNDLHHGRACV